LLEGSYLVILPVILLIASFYFVDKVLDRWAITSWAGRLLFYLVVMLALTAVTDLALWHMWASFNLLVGGPPVKMLPFWS
jgi:hypothetical protein